MLRESDVVAPDHDGEGQKEPQRKARKVFKERILALKALGWRDIQIARKLKICRRSVQRVVSEHRGESPQYVSNYEITEKEPLQL
jgi:AraC-like DNA-binding protein